MWKLAKRLDLDYQEFDMVAFGYQTIKEQMMKHVGLKTVQMQEKEFLVWNSMAEMYDNTPLEEKVYVPDDLQAQSEFINCLVLCFSSREYGYAVRLLTAKFKANMMERTKKIIEANKKIGGRKERFLWFMGWRENTDKILRELEHFNVHPRILRNSFLRRHYLHYYHGQIIQMKQKDFIALTKKQNIVFINEENRSHAEMLSHN